MPIPCLFAYKTKQPDSNPNLFEMSIMRANSL